MTIIRSTGRIRSADQRIRSPLIGELVPHAAAGTLRLQYSTFCELGEIALRCGGADMSQGAYFLLVIPPTKPSGLASSKAFNALRCRSLGAA